MKIMLIKLRIHQAVSRHKETYDAYKGKDEQRSQYINLMAIAALITRNTMKQWDFGID